MTIKIDRPRAEEAKLGNANLNIPWTVSEEKICKRIVASLTDDEVEHAARCSYRYYMASVSANGNPPSIEERDNLALKMARRHLIARKGDEESALKSVRQTIKYRVEAGVDDIRRAFYEKDVSDLDRSRRFAAIRAGIESQLTTKVMYVRGYDRKGRPLFIMDAGASVEWDEDWFVPLHVYMMERTIACLDRATDGQEERLHITVDYGRYSSKNAPPLKLAKSLLKVLANHWPERVEVIVLLDAPLIFRAFWTMMQPFIDPDTKSKIRFLTGDNQKRSVLEGLISEQEACPFMFPEGQKTTDFDMHSFLYKIPFERTCDESCDPSL
mmetsp:Transcript_5570/g.11595  ORF Transcript_5570/g.11595 Transcript_5570/m.11595 type:complete len:326 (-) Transcript_5570:103-1080(-)|eukprot:CAMPEP_0183307036 /NCGR_PEP_ID=MMETSP0160_2-20130417/15665_1 /TAXON_ID=2839 ORGANISM="Odontella Sinensis, Strain Grunow 1884" /NCGR_SAMPLE_ID=MMETSP0160_2 /ASSEMBLY_ACC=CAM_ASM_000250 /LENGTH=325 /DNA_ID=CAMNT_0025470535 /DNA_START=50 /DNA_END=1027 /DNA_ORIENTATION=-